MALLDSILSFRIMDADKERVSMPLYAKVDDTTALSDLATAAGAFGNDMDPVIDGQITRIRWEVDIPVNPAWKSTPVSGAEIERVGAWHYTLSVPIGKSFTIDVPTFAYSLFTGNTIDQGGTGVAAFRARLESASPPVMLDEKWNGQIEDLLSARKAFRKHRRQTSRG